MIFFCFCVFPDLPLPYIGVLLVLVSGSLKDGVREKGRDAGEADEEDGTVCAARAEGAD